MIGIRNANTIPTLDSIVGTGTDFRTQDIFIQRKANEPMNKISCNI